MLDAVLNVKRSSWLLRRILKRSPVGEPAALTAATYVALRAVALRAEHPVRGTPGAHTARQLHRPDGSPIRVRSPAICWRRCARVAWSP